jgi:hypothetical protein
MYSAGATPKLLGVGFPIRRSTDQRLLTAPRGLSQFCHVLHRLLVPRHPPNALTSLTTKTGSSRQPGAELLAARTRRQTVKSRSSFALHLRERVSLSEIEFEYPRRKLLLQRPHHEAATGSVLGLMRMHIHSSACFSLPYRQASGRQHSVFVLHASFYYLVVIQSPRRLVEDKGIEPSTLGLQSQCSPS